MRFAAWGVGMRWKELAGVRQALEVALLVKAEAGEFQEPEGGRTAAGVGLWVAAGEQELEAAWTMTAAEAAQPWMLGWAAALQAAAAARVPAGARRVLVAAAAKWLQMWGPVGAQPGTQQPLRRQGTARSAAARQSWHS